MTTSGEGAVSPDGPAPPYGQPASTEDQRGEDQPADAESAEESREMAAAVEDPDPAA